MENISKQITKEELFGLPGVGKSYVLKNLLNRSESAVEVGYSFSKAKNIIYGLKYFPFRIFIKMLLNIQQEHLKGGMKLILVLLERLGRYKLSDVDLILDEGVFQALWGYMYRANNNEQLINEILIHLKRYSIDIRYVGTSKSINKDFLDNRDNHKFYFKNKQDYIKGRENMASLIKLIKRNNIKVKYIFNGVRK